ncbi:hypothetical protein [Streptomyces sp. Ru62]|uniref:hypothetical protein n=1 Tax=Streptomyces sp. Ru62 TaxID=2080745 RepID=UPI0015E30E2B|nr:hypothetical protein [Streptomyces sp. Ru62]
MLEFRPRPQCVEVVEVGESLVPVEGEEALGLPGDHGQDGLSLVGNQWSSCDPLTPAARWSGSLFVAWTPSSDPALLWCFALLSAGTNTPREPPVPPQVRLDPHECV